MASTSQHPARSVTRLDTVWLVLGDPNALPMISAIGSPGSVPDHAATTIAPRGTGELVTSVTVEFALSAAATLGWSAQAVVPSRLPGPSGNREFFVHLARRAPVAPVDVAASVGLG